jgi:outer membrane protein assembly factor BamA
VLVATLALCGLPTLAVDPAPVQTPAKEDEQAPPAPGPLTADATTGEAAATPRISDLIPVGSSGGAGSGVGRRIHLPGVPDDNTLESNRAVIGEVRIRVGDIFDPELPEEDRWLFRAANRLHIKTRERVIRNLLLFEAGDTFSRRVLDESERVLRASSYLYDARIYPVRYDDNTVAVEVVTRDVWTLSVGVSYSRSGGENKTKVGIEDSNFLGTGKELSIKRTSDLDRTSYQARYLDPNLLGSRVRMQLGYADNSDGRNRAVQIQRPFYSLDSRWAAGLRATQDELEQPLFDLGEEVTEFRQTNDFYEAFFGRSIGLRDGQTRRWSFGVTYSRKRFEELRGETNAPLPDDRTFTSPWIGFQWIRDGFVKVHDLDQLRRTEDLNLGHDLRTRLGWTVSALDSQPDRALFDTAYDFGKGLGNGQILLSSARVSGRVHDGVGENVLVRGRARYYLRDFGRHLFFVSLRTELGTRLDGERQLLLGGDSGLRGYPNRYAAGDRSYLVTLEQRFYTDWHLFRLVHVGAAVFFDAGEAWYHGDRSSGLGLLRDVGFGLRIGSSRSSSASMVHVDVAFPLDGDRSIDDVQFVIKSRESF